MSTHTRTLGVDISRLSGTTYEAHEIEAWLQYHRAMRLIECDLPRAPLKRPLEPVGEDPFEGPFEFLIADFRYYPTITGEIY